MEIDFIKIRFEIIYFLIENISYQNPFRDYYFLNGNIFWIENRSHQNPFISY